MNRNLAITATRAVQSFIDAKKAGIDPSQESLDAIRRYRTWNENELIGLRNASFYYPDIFFEDNMDASIATILQGFKSREVPHKFIP
jgi:hypothetical protein